MMRSKQTDDLCRNPLWRPEDLGKPIPNSPHAISVGMPLWEHVVRYEEGDAQVVNALTIGYPRFIFHPLVKEFFRVCTDRFAREGESCLAFPSTRVAERCADFVCENAACEAQVHEYGSHGIFVTTFPEEAFETGAKFWRHTGEIVSSRLVQAILEGNQCPPAGDEAKHTLRTRLARMSGRGPGDVFLYPTGMAAVSGAQHLVQTRSPGAKTVQIGFPYVDVLKLQTKCGPGAHFFPHPDEDALHSLETLLDNEKIAGAFCEYPSNPLLQSADIPRLSAILRARAVPLIVD